MLISFVERRNSLTTITMRAIGKGKKRYGLYERHSSVVLISHVRVVFIHAC